MQSGIQCRRDLREVCYHTGRLVVWVILPEWNEIIMFFAKEFPNVLCSACQSIVGGYSDQNGSAITQVTLC